LVFERQEDRLVEDHVLRHRLAVALGQGEVLLASVTGRVTGIDADANRTFIQALFDQL